MPPADVAWLLLAPFLLLAAPLTVVLAGPLGGLLFPDPGYHYWSEITVVRKPAVQAGCVLAIGWSVVFVAALVTLAQRPLHLPVAPRRAAVVVVQALLVALLAACWIAQRGIASGDARRVYFTTSTVVVALALAVVVAAVLVRRGRAGARREPRPARPRLRRALAWGSAAVALVATAVWVLPAVYTDAGLRAGPDALFLGAWFLDESSAVLNGRWPLVDMVAYGNLWPYLVAVPLGAFGDTYLTYTTTMAVLTAVGLLALFATLVRVTRQPALALALYLPVLAMAFFLEVGTLVARYSPGTYYGMFPLRFAGPCLLALLTTLHVGADPRRRSRTILLFAAGGLVALNNLDFGSGALAGAAVAVALVRGAFQPRALARLLAELALGLALALALVVINTLLRAGELPNFSLLTRYGRIFVVGGNGNLPLPALGLHVAIAVTFAGALATAGVRAAARTPNVELTAMLAFSGLFGLGASLYYYAYRSHPDVLINLFPIWAFSLALLVVVVRDSTLASGRIALPGLAVLFAFGLAACSLAQAPDPWAQARRIDGRLAPGEQSYIPANAFRAPALRRIVADGTRPAEPVLILSPTGHRVAEDAGVVNVSPYPGLGQMPAREQLTESIEALRDAGGTKVFVLDRVPQQFQTDMRRRGFAPPELWSVSGWPSQIVMEYRLPQRAS